MRFRWLLFGILVSGLVFVLINLPFQISTTVFIGLIIASLVVAFVASGPQFWVVRWVRRSLEMLLRALPEAPQSEQPQNPAQISGGTLALANAEPLEPIARISIPAFERTTNAQPVQYAFDPVMWPAWQQLLGVLGGLALMFAGQLTLYRGADYGTSVRGYTLLLLGVVIFFAVLSGTWLSENAAIPLPRKIQRIHIRWAWLILSIGLAIWNAYLTADGKDYIYLAQYIIMWLASIGAFVMAVSPRKGEMAHSDTNPLHKWEYGLLVALFLGAFAARVINVNHEPYLMDSDEALFAAEGASYPGMSFQITPFQPGVHSHPRLYMSMIGVSTSIFGDNLLGARLPSVLLGALTIPALFLLGRELRDWQAGLVAALFMLGWSYHIQFSRLSMNQPADPLFGTLAFYFLLRGFRRGAAVDYALSGIMVGFAQYFYIGGRLVPLVMIAYLFFIWLREREVVKRQWHLILIIPVAAILVTLPQNYYLLSNHEPLSTRTENSDIANGVLQSHISDGSLPTYLRDQTQYSFLALLSVTDNSAWYGRSSTLMGIVGGPLLVIGVYMLAFLLWKWPKWSLPVGWALAVILADATFATSPPSYERYFPAVSAFSLLVEAGVALVAVAIARAIKRPAASRTIAIGIGVVALVVNLYFYVGVYIPEGQYLNLRTNWMGNRLGQQMIDEYNQGRQVVLLSRFDTPVQNFVPVQFFMANKPFIDSSDDLVTTLTHVLIMQPASFFVPPQRKADLDQLQKYFPDGKTYQISLDQDKELAFYLFKMDGVPKDSPLRELVPSPTPTPKP